MFALNKKTDYGLIALSHMARSPGELFSARQIAGSYGMSDSLLMNVLKTLTRKGLVVSQRGSNGGYRLARGAEQISLAQLVQAIEGSLKLVACVNKQEFESDVGSRCDLEDLCPVQWPVRKIHLKLVEFLQSVSLADLLNDNFQEKIPSETKEIETTHIS